MKPATKTQRFRVIYKIPESTLNTFRFADMTAYDIIHARRMFQAAHPLLIIKEILYLDAVFTD